MNFSELKNSSFVLSKENMKQVKGGGTCGYKTSTGTIECGVSKDEALHMVTDQEGNIHGNWCCDSCGGSSYCS